MHAWHTTASSESSSSSNGCLQGLQQQQQQQLQQQTAGTHLWYNRIQETWPSQAVRILALQQE
jgi:hypothetical protein